MATATHTEFDIDAMFTPQMTSADFAQESQMDIDEAITQALADIDQHGPLPLSAAETSEFDELFAQSLHGKKDYPNSPMGKPLSPQSLRSDESLFNSPAEPSTPHDMSQEFQHLKGEIKKLQEHNSRKCVEVTIAMEELKKSEKKRLALMEENRALKEALVQATMNI